jgi:hypothetical protein
MGYMRNHAICVTSYLPAAIEEAHRWAKENFKVCAVTEITPVAVNGYQSFFIAPDGSKEWWETSDAGNKERKDFEDYISTSLAKKFGYCPLDWVEVQYGDDEGETKIIASDDFREGGK